MLRKSLVKQFVIGLFALGMLFSMRVTVVSACSTLTGRTVKGTVSNVACESTMSHEAVKTDPQPFDDAIKTWNYVFISDRTGRSISGQTLTRSSDGGIDSALMDNLLKSMQVTNDKIAKGELFL